MLVSDFDFDLPKELIAQEPPAERSGARMLQLDRATGVFHDSWFREFPALLRAGDVLVLNDSRVIPARLLGQKVIEEGKIRSGQVRQGRVEALLTQQMSEWEWTALVRPGRKVLGSRFAGFHSMRELLVARLRSKRRSSSMGNLVSGCCGSIRCRISSRASTKSATCRCRLTFIARTIAATGSATRPSMRNSPVRPPLPRRGCTLPPRCWRGFVRAECIVCFVTLHVGLGTFQPIRVERVEDIHLHEEHYTLPESTAVAVNAALAEGRRVVAAGTTTVRTLEHCAAVAEGGPLTPHSGATNIFISPGYQFRVVERPADQLPPAAVEPADAR